MAHQQIFKVVFVFNVNCIVRNVLLLVACTALPLIIYKVMDPVYKIVKKDNVIIYKIRLYKFIYKYLNY